MKGQPVSFGFSLSPARGQRAGIILNDGRRVTETTYFHQEGLLVKFRDWLVETGDDFDRLVMSRSVDLDELSPKLVDSGRWLFAEGKPYYHLLKPSMQSPTAVLW